MDQILTLYGKDMLQLIKESELSDHAILGAATELFSDDINVTRIAFLIAFAKKFIEVYPEKKLEVFEDIFHAIYCNMKF